MVETRITWRANDGSSAVGNRSLLRAPPLSPPPQSAVRIVPANHWTETRRRSTKPLVPPSTDSGGSLPSSIVSASLDRYAPRDRIGSKLAVPCASRSKESLPQPHQPQLRR